MERVPRVGGGIQGSAALKSAQCRKLYFGICVLHKWKLWNLCFGAETKPSAHTCSPPVCMIFVFFQLAFTAIESQLSLCRMVVLYQLNCQRMVAQWMGEGENTKGQYSDYTEDVR